MRGMSVLLTAVMAAPLCAQGFAPDVLAPPVAAAGLSTDDRCFAVDVNVDGRPDLLGRDKNGDGAFVVLQLPDGSFDAGHLASLLVGFSFPKPRAADFDGDGVPDLASTWESGCVVRLGYGDASFAPKHVTETGPVYRDAEAYADFDGDGLPDAMLVLVKVSTSGRLVGAAGSGDGGFGGFGELATLRVARDLQAADLDGDGDLDLVALEASSQTGTATHAVVTLLNPGNGKLVKQPGAVPVGKGSLAPPADIGADGILDVLSFGDAGGTVLLLKGDGSGGLQTQELLQLPADPLIRDVVAADLDHDGYLDLVLGTNAQGVLLQRLVRAQTSGEPQAAPSLHSSYRLAAADFDGDGLADVASVDTAGTQVFFNAQGPFIDVGLGSPGGPTLALDGEPAPGEGVTVSLIPAGAPTAGALLVGLQPLLADSPAGLIVVDPLLLLPLALPASLQAHWPAGLLGTPITLQGVALGSPPHAGNAVVVVPEP
jgi:hypothetical protein